MLLKAYAKVNLILKVLGKRIDNYHEIQMLNAKINIYDEIDINKNNDKCDKVVFKNCNYNFIKDDFVLNCMKAIKNHYNINDNFTIIITKNIPIGAGLGGGSCDVSTIVLYLLKLYKIKYSLNELYIILKDYGADIPYCLNNGFAIVEGIGEKINKIDCNFMGEFIIVNPNICISTKEIFDNVERYSIPFAQQTLIEKINKIGYFAFTNELEDAAFKIFPKLKDIKTKLSKIGYTIMSGSGSTMMVFGNNLCDMYEKIKKIYPKYFVKKVKIIKENEDGNQSNK